MRHLSVTGQASIPSNDGAGISGIFDAMRSGEIKAVVIMADGMDPENSAYGDIAHALDFA